MHPNRQRALLGKSVLWICDVHLKTHQTADEFDRVDAFGEMVLDFKPTSVKIGGDFVEMDSIKKSVMEGPSGFDKKYLEKEQKLFRFGLQAILRPMEKANQRHIAAGHRERVYYPEDGIDFLEGNHEARHRHSRSLDPDELRRIVEGLGIRWHELGEPDWYQGVGFSHLKKAGAKGRGRYPQGASISTIINGHRSMVVGDNHGLDVRMSSVSDGSLITAVKGGCMVSHEEIDRLTDEWAGVLHLTHMKNGEFCLHQYPYDWVMERYGQGGYAQRLRTQRAQQAQDLEDAEATFS
jgi:hypothetical protein